MKKRIAILLLMCMLFSTFFAVFSINSSAEENIMKIDAKSAILMEAETGKILYEQNAYEALPPASVTKIMTLLLVMEAIDSGKISLDEKVCVSENASQMGGSQVYLKAGEEMSVEDLLKSVVVSSANDSAVALAEHICGSEGAFVNEMNKKAKALGMKNTNFENTNGLDDTTQNHVTSAHDIAVMSRELIKHKKILEYSSIWMSTIRDGAFTLTNTNRLIRFYPGATGLKTGSTSKAKFCISATAERNGMHLIAVIMGAPSRDIRNEEAKKLLDYGFANYALYTYEKTDLGKLSVLGGTSDFCNISADKYSAVLDKGIAEKVTTKIEAPEKIAAPIASGQKIGKIIFMCNDEKIGETDIVASETIGKISYWEIFIRILRNFMVVK